MSYAPRYDGLAGWYEEFRPAMKEDEVDVLVALLGAGGGRCLDLGCGTGVSAQAVAELGWSVVGVDVSTDLLEVARGRGLDVVEASAAALPFEDASFDAAVSMWTHTDIDDFHAAVAEAARVLRPAGPLVYIGAHPCFVGPHCIFVGQGDPPREVPELHPGYRQNGRYDASAPGVVNPDGVRIRVGGVHLTLAAFFGAFAAAGLSIERFEELGDADYPHAIALRARR